MRPFCWILLACSITGCDRPAPPASPTTTAIRPTKAETPKASQAFILRPKLTPKVTSQEVSSPVFLERAAQAQIDHRYESGPKALQLMVQPTGGGCGWIDYDRDGLWDLYLNQGGDPSAPPAPSQPSDQLYRNAGSGQFQVVTDPAKIEDRDFSQGVAVGDFDNDGFEDLLVTNAGRDTLFHNLGDGTFADASGSLEQPNAWSSSAAWGDIDRDGDLDLYVCRYVDFDRFRPQLCRTAKGEPKMCQPNEVEPIADEMYLNNGDGTFSAVAKARGLFGPGNRALGVAIADFDNDGWPDIYVANDATANFLFINQHDGQFKNMADALGCAVTWEGRAQASMGVGVADYDHNGFLDLYLTHFEGEWNTLYRNLGPRGFSDVTATAGGVEPTLPMVGFGTVMEDFNQDGNEDVIVANGHLDDPGHLGIELAMKPQLFSLAGLRMKDQSAAGGDYFQQKSIGRGLATADYDDDGDLDVAIVNQAAPLALLENQSARGHWLKLEFVARGNRRGIGTRVKLQSGQQVFMRELVGGATYCATNQPVLVFGLGAEATPCRLEIQWPDGLHQTLENVTIDQTLRLFEPDAAAASPPP